MLIAPVAYDPNWQDAFRDIQMRLANALGLPSADIAHIGSTSVVGLTAKPIIDIQIGLQSLDDFDAGVLEQAGFTPVTRIDRDDQPVWDHGIAEDWSKRYARLEEDGRHLAHLHFRKIGARNHRFALVFRDYLRVSPDVCRLYEQQKAVAATLGMDSSHAGGSGVYQNVKDPFVALVGRNAWEWAERTNWRDQERPA